MTTIGKRTARIVAAAATIAALGPISTAGATPARAQVTVSPIDAAFKAGSDAAVAGWHAGATAATSGWLAGANAAKGGFQAGLDLLGIQTGLGGNVSGPLGLQAGLGGNVSGPLGLHAGLGGNLLGP